MKKIALVALAAVAGLAAPALAQQPAPAGPPVGPDWSKIMDVIMLCFTGGRQRSRSEHERLLNTAGFRLERVIPTMSDMSILEAVPA